MDNTKCDCGAVKVYGPDTTLHATYCSALKRDPDPEPDGAPDWPWDSSGWIMSINQETPTELKKTNLTSSNLETILVV